MNKSINKLFEIAQKPVRNIIGLMSGTSLDGLDVALCQISGSGENTSVKITHFETVSYSEEIKADIRTIFAKTTINFQHLALLNEWIGNLHAEIILNLLNKWKINSFEIDLIASHGQTVMHLPKILHRQKKYPNATLQIGDGDHIAVKTGIITVSDFRQKHLAAGGEGAPLAIYGDFFVFTKKGENRIMLNIGGIANFTFLPENANPAEIFVTDTGPGNTLLDAFTQQYFPDLSYDKDAEISTQGIVNQTLLSELKKDDFFKAPFPKSTGPELFNKEYVNNTLKKLNITNISCFDLLATLTQFSADTIAQAILNFVSNKEKKITNFKVYLSGGGAHNPLLIKKLKELVSAKFYTTDELGISGDAKEALLFAVLANETIAGGNCNFDNKNQIPSVCMGKISLPN